MSATATASVLDPIPAAGEPRDLPLIIGGQRVDTRGRETIELQYPTGVIVRMPALTDDLVNQLLALDPLLLADVPLQEIVAFLNRVGKAWKDEESTRRRLYVRQLQGLLGLSQTAAEAEADWIGVLLTSHARAYDQLDSELGSRFVVDEWVAREEALVRAVPRGRVVHLLPGNVPLSAAVSLLRGLITKNTCIAKAASGDPLTPAFLALSFLDLDPEHPVSRAMSAVYWPQGDAGGQRIATSADAICAWGGREALAWAKEHAAEDVPVVSFGPKRSLGLVGRDADLRAAARGAAHDVSRYEQRACFSVQQLAVERPAEPFLAELQAALVECSEVLPVGQRSFDEAARATLLAREEELLGSQVIRSADATIVVRPLGPVAEHPLCRTVFVHPVDDLREALELVDADVQTVAASPWSRLYELRDDIARAGASRLVELGLCNVFRPGGTHDGVEPLSRLVRMVAMERPAATHGKGMVVSIDQTELLKAGELRSLVL